MGRQESCKTCRFWEQCDAVSEASEEEAGRCHRFPPANYIRRFDGEWPEWDHSNWTLPVTGQDDWCGEWKRSTEVAREGLKVGISCSKLGLTPEQEISLAEWLQRNRIAEFHHRGRAGERQALMVAGLGKNEIEFVSHHWRKGPLNRDRSFLHVCDVLIVCPSGFVDQDRRTTMSDVRVFRQLGRQVVLIDKDGDCIEGVIPQGLHHAVLASVKEGSTDRGAKVRDFTFRILAGPAVGATVEHTLWLPHESQDDSVRKQRINQLAIHAHRLGLMKKVSGEGGKEMLVAVDGRHDFSDCLGATCVIDVKHEEQEYITVAHLTFEGVLMESDKRCEKVPMGKVPDGLFKPVDTRSKSPWDDL